mgnify:FL=1
MRSKKRGFSREEVDDRKFLNSMEGERFRKRIEREANEAILCPRCGSYDWKMQSKYVVNWLANELLATMVCRKCKRKALFATQIEPDPIEPDLAEEDEEGINDYIDQVCRQLRITGVHPIIKEILKTRLKRRLLRLDTDERIRLLMYLR